MSEKCGTIEGAKGFGAQIVDEDFGIRRSVNEGGRETRVVVDGVVGYFGGKRSGAGGKVGEGRFALELTELVRSNLWHCGGVFGFGFRDC